MIKKMPVESNRQTTIILLVTPFLLAFYRYFGMPANYDQLLSGRFSGAYLSGFYRDFFNFFMAFILLFLIPALIIKLVFKEKLRAYGFARGDLRLGIKLIIISLPLIVISGWASARRLDFQKEYSAFKINPLTLKAIIIYALAFFFYYFAFEFFFRGFLLQGLKPAFGSLNALLIQTIPCCLVHLGKPVSEVFASIVASLLFGYFVLRTRSLWYIIIIHWLVGVCLNIFIGLTLN
ncbi:MAG: CPBP family intramembrane glutamic endopeptidase [Candidatus Saccharicenans sp.]